MALLPIANSMLQKIARFVELAASQQQNLNASADDQSSSGDEDDVPDLRDPAEGSWVKTSMEKIEHFLEAQKYSNYISHPVHLAEYANNMLVEQMMMSTAVKDIAKGLKEQYLEEKEKGDMDVDDIPLANRLKRASPKKRKGFFEEGETSTNQNPMIPHGLRAFGRASRGDAFFNDVASSSLKSSVAEDGNGEESEQSPKSRRQRRGKKRNRPVEPFNPSVRDYFDDPFSNRANNMLSKINVQKETDNTGGTNSSANRSRWNCSSKSKNESQSGSRTTEDGVHPHGLGNFVRHAADIIRVADRKYQMQDDAINGFLNERKNQRTMDYAIRRPNLLDKSREFLIEVTVYAHPNEEEIGSLDICSSVMHYKIEILGSKTLADLRDAMMCDNDYMFLKEMQHPDDVQDMDELAKNKIQSAMLLIDNTIYNDTRWPKNFDYASQIIRWTGVQPSKKIGPFKRGDMSCTKLEELTIQFGFPYLFRHLGDCEHVIVFNKARLLTLEDEHRLSHFPRISWISDTRPQLCRIDNDFIATWAVLDYDNFPENPMLICTNCLKGFCYNKYGDKRGRFQLFPYRQLICEMPLPSEKLSRKWDTT